MPVACLSGLAAGEAISKNSFLKDLAAASPPVILGLTREVKHSCLELDVKVVAFP